MVKHLVANIEKEGDGYVAQCPEVDVASQGDSIEEAKANLKEALELFFETASEEEIEFRLHNPAHPGKANQTLIQKVLNMRLMI